MNCCANTPQEVRWGLTAPPTGQTLLQGSNMLREQFQYCVNVHDKPKGMSHMASMGHHEAHGPRSMSCAVVQDPYQAVAPRVSE